MVAKMAAFHFPRIKSHCQEVSHRVAELSLSAFYRGIRFTEWGLAQ
jgi:hypothetical protein